MKKNNFSTYLLIISVMTFITLFVVIVSKSYDNLMIPLNLVQNNSMGKSINLDLKTDVINQIESRQ
ncbi:MAG: hypothetical protein WC069_03760 [Candidatus Shapirobacteria bacterium]